MLRHLGETFPKRAEDYIIDAYSRPPSDVRELERLLDTYIPGHAARRHILEEVKRKVASSQPLP